MGFKVHFFAKHYLDVYMFIIRHETTMLVYYMFYCTISINSAGGVTCDALAENFASAKSRVDKGQGQISARGNVRPPIPGHNAGMPMSKDLWCGAPMKDHGLTCVEKGKF